jgi:hypothetical protein
MVDEQNNTAPSNDEQVKDEEETPPAMQSLLDNPFLLLFIGVTIPAVFYTIWGIMEVAQIPIGQ